MTTLLRVERLTVAASGGGDDHDCHACGVPRVTRPLALPASLGDR
jgi:hypothetical protein